MEEDNRSNREPGAPSSKGKHPRSSGSSSIDAATVLLAVLTLSAVYKEKLSQDRSRLDLFTVSWEHIILDRWLHGSGSCGDVYLGTLHKENVALKKLRSNDKEDFENEAGISLSLSHKNVVSFRGVCLDGPEHLDRCIIMEALPGGTLYDKIPEGESDDSPTNEPQEKHWEDHEDQSNTVPKISIGVWMERLKMAMDAAHGLLYLHNKSVVHGDFCSRNLMFSSEGIIKVIDFGFSSYNGKNLLYSNPRWQAPEVSIKGEDTSFQSDVFSFGIVLWEILMWKHAWEDIDVFALHLMLETNCSRPQVHGDLPQELPGVKDFVSIMKECWAEDPKQRPDMYKVVGCLNSIWALAAREGKQERAGSGMPQTSSVEQTLEREANVVPQSSSVEQTHEGEANVVPQSSSVEQTHEGEGSVLPQSFSVEQTHEGEASVEIENPARYHQPSSSKWVRFRGSLRVAVKKLFSCGHPLDLDQLSEVSSMPWTSTDPNRPSPFINHPVMPPTIEDSHEGNTSVASLPQNPHHSDARQKLKAAHPNQAGLMEIRDYVIEAMQRVTSLQRSPTWMKVAYVVRGWGNSGSAVTNEDFQRLLMEVHGGQASRDNGINSAQAGHPWDKLNKLIGKIMVPGMLSKLEDGKPPKLRSQSAIPKKNVELSVPSGGLICPLAKSI